MAVNCKLLQDFLNERDLRLCLPFIFKATAIDFTVRTEE